MLTFAPLQDILLVGPFRKQVLHYVTFPIERGKVRPCLSLPARRLVDINRRHVFYHQLDVL